MRNGYYWAKFSTKDDYWLLLAVSNDMVYILVCVEGVFTPYDFGTTAEFTKRFPDIELIEIEKPTGVVINEI